jgi:phenylacetate-coenzyme A ligase PaaK-like adenylate-forming protein
MRGELLITRPGESLPLVRYPTGDMIEVLDPFAELNIPIDGGAVATLPLIRMLGRSVDTLDFEVPDEMGCFLGNKIYSHHIHEALQRPNNVRWWELYNIRGEPGRLCFLVIPDKEVEDHERFRKETLRHLLRECDDPHHTLQIGHELGRVEVLSTRPHAYRLIQQEIDKRVKEGRSLGQLKPKRIFKVNSEDEFRTVVRDKLEA